MAKGTPSSGKENKKVHITCRRCGSRSFHLKTSVCSACGFGKSSKLKKAAFQWKTLSGKRRK